MRTRLVVFTNRQYKRDNGRLSVNSLTVIQIERQTGVLMIGGAKLNFPELNGPTETPAGGYSSKRAGPSRIFLMFALLFFW